MSHRIAQSKHGALASLAGALLVLSGPAWSQVGTLTTVSGRVVDMSRTTGGELLFCTQQGNVGTIDAAGSVTLLATSATAPFPNNLRAVAPASGGDIAVLDSGSDIYLLPGGATPAQLFYSDLYIVNDPTDLILDAAGNFVITSNTATSGVRAVDWVSADGQSWSYYKIAHTPIAVAADPLGGDLLIADANNGGALRSIDAADESHPTSALDTATQPGFSLGAQDGDMAVETDGDVLFIAGGSVYRFDRDAGTSGLIASGLGALRGIAIATSSGSVPSASGWSAYVAQDAGSQTNIREIGNVGAPADVTAADLGSVPNRGQQLMFFSGIHAFDLEVDAGGDLVICGEQWGADYAVRRIELPSLNVSVIADDTDGISGRVEGVSPTPDGGFYILTSPGHIQRIEPNGLVSTIYADPLGLVGTGKDLVWDRNGFGFIANYNSWGNGSLVRRSPNGNATTLLSTSETRGLAPDPGSAQMLLTEWVNSGFHSRVHEYAPLTNDLTPIPGFDQLNLTNAAAWGDGKLVLDVEGNIYVTSEDDFSLYRFNRGTGKKVRIGSGYINHPTGLAIARSTIASTTGWSLFVAEWNFLWEIADVPAPASRKLDFGAPPTGRVVASLHPDSGIPRALAADPLSGGLLVTTSEGRLMSVDKDTGSWVTLTTSPQVRDMVDIGATSTGSFLIATDVGDIFEVDRNTGWVVAPVFIDSLDALRDVRAMTVDWNDRAVLVNGPGPDPASEIYRLEAGSLVRVALASRGARIAADPMTGDFFVTEQGSVAEGAGEILRVDGFASPPTYGHWRGDGYLTFEVGAADGGIVFDDAGNFYVASGDDGRVWFIDRSTGQRSLVAGQYERPRSLLLAPGTAGVAGSSGTSLFVIDEQNLYEVGVEGLPAPPPAAAPPGLLPSADITVAGFVTPGDIVPVKVRSAGDAGLPYVVFASFLGKTPGLPLGLLGDPSDTRVMANNYNVLWTLVGDAFLLPGFLGVLDGSGESPPGTGFQIPNDPSLLDVKTFIDLTWVSLDSFAQSGIATVGGTAHLYLGP